jgi:hypothetical protein
MSVPTITALVESIAARLAGSSTIRQHCEDSWGQPLRVFVDGLGTWEEAELPGESPQAPTPYAIVTASDDSESGKETGEETHTVAVRIVADASQLPSGGWRDGSKPEQALQSGVLRLPGGPAFQQLVALARAVAGADGHGALYRRCRTAYDGMHHYPVQYADQYFDFYSINTF